MNIYVNGKDITQSVEVAACIYDMYAANHADVIKLELNDDGNMKSWGWKRGDSLVITEESLNTGMMHIIDIKMTNTKIKVKASSVIQRDVLRTKTWRKTTFLSIGKQIADENGWKFMPYGIKDKMYEYLVQREKDLRFYGKLCTVEGCGLLVHDNKLIAYSLDYMKDSAYRNIVKVDESVNFTVKQGEKANKITLKNGESSFVYKKDGDGVEIEKSIDFYIPDKGTGLRFAKNMMADFNRDYMKATMEVNDLAFGYAAGTSAQLVFDKASALSGTFMFERVRMDLMKKTTKIFARGLDDV